MDNKDVAIGFTLVVAVALGVALNNWYSIIIDLLLLSSYSFIKHMYVVYKTEGTYLNRVSMKPAYGLLAISVLSFGILRILYIYANVFASYSLYSSMPWILKIMFYVDMLFLLVFLYLLIKFIFVDFLELRMPNPETAITEFKEGEDVQIKEEKEEKEVTKEEEQKIIKEDRGGIKKLPVIIVSRG